MKNGLKLMLLICLSSQNIYAQYGTINSVYLFPSNPTDADTIYAVADLSFYYDNCILNNSYTAQNGNNLHLHTNYCISNVQTNCSKIDTLNLGVFAAGTYTTNFSLAVRPNNCIFPGLTINTVSIDTLTIGLFTNINVNEVNRDYSLFPNPTHNSEVNVKTTDRRPFGISCFNNIGMLVFEMNNLTGNQKINLPEVKGIYFIKITDKKASTTLLNVLIIKVKFRKIA